MYSSTICLNSVAIFGPRSVSTFFPSTKNRSRRRLACARQRDADVGLLGLAWSIDDAAHYREAHGLDARILPPPLGHAVADHFLHVACELLEHGGSGSSAA